jgi:hypothetical protein
MLVIGPLECIPGAVFSGSYTKADGKKEGAVGCWILREREEGRGEPR